MYEYLNGNVSINFHKPSEFLSVMYAAANWELYQQVGMDFHDQRDDQNLKIIEQIRSKLSRYLQQELRFFFQLQPGQSALVFTEYVLPKFVDETVPIFIDRVANSGERELIRVLLTRIPEKAEMSRLLHLLEQSHEALPDSLEKELTLLDVPGQPNVVDAVLECVRYPQEALMRLATVMTRFYDVYRSFESQLETASLSVMEAYDQMLRNNSKEFFEQVLKINTPSFSRGYMIHLCACMPISVGVATSELNRDRPIWVRLGTDVLNSLGRREEQEKILQFFKALSDKHRLDIIRRLSDRPWYGNELAQVLDLSPASVIYHMNFLLDLEIVTAEKVENRVYFTLHPEKLDSLFNFARTLVVSRS